MTAAQLKAGILDLAIRGRLVPQDPNDEPAEKLRMRILGEQSATLTQRAQRTQRGAKSLCASANFAFSVSAPAGRNPVNPVNPVKKPPPIPDDEKPFPLPNGWTWCRLGDVADKITDGTHKTPRYVAQGVKFVSAKDIVDGVLTFDKCKFVTEEEHRDLYQRCNPEKGDLLISKSGSIGATALVDVDFEFSLFESLALLKYNQAEILPSYLMYAVRQLCGRLQLQDIKGVGVKHLHLGVLSRQVIPLPPLAEQRRIVAKVEELMPLVKRYEAAEQKRAHLDAALPEALKKSILKAAFDGALVEGCAFEEKPLKEACADIFTGNSLSDAEKRAFARADGLPFIGTKDVGFDRRLDYENGIRIPASEPYRTAPAGATLLCIEGGSSGRKIGLLDRAVRFGNKLCAFAPGEDLDSRYLFLYLQSPQFLEQFTALQNGPRKGAGISQVKALTIRTTDPARQRKLVERIESLLRHADEIAVA